MEQLAINERVGYHWSSSGTPASHSQRSGDAKAPEAREFPVPSTPSREVKAVEIKETVKVREAPVQEKADKKLWASSRLSAGRTRHWVAQASCGIPLDEWATACGWHFARTNVKVELTKSKVSGPKECMKCAAVLKGRDGVRGGWDLAQRWGCNAVKASKRCFGLVKQQLQEKPPEIA